MLRRFGDGPWGLIFPLVALGGLVLVGYAHARGQQRLSVRPVGGHRSQSLPQPAPRRKSGVQPDYSQCRSGGLRATGGLIWWLIGMVPAACYFILTYRLFRGKVQAGAAH